MGLIRVWKSGESEETAQNAAWMSVDVQLSYGGSKPIIFADAAGNPVFAAVAYKNSLCGSNSYNWHNIKQGCFNNKYFTWNSFFNFF